MQAQATCLPRNVIARVRHGRRRKEPAVRRDDAPAAPVPGSAAEPTEGAGHRSWTAALLAERPSVSLRDELSRFGVGLGLASLYGLSLGARQGGVRSSATRPASPRP